ncbi:Homeobox protein HAT3.1 [Zea mays]|uniref:Homeobox protein HAT3.1 n=1 Tax=Zea mays TaxID=4577 RepID=A0A1D6H9Z9_MAIZE|nr:Homeobox protein HAT3.1 [Zea mays]
MTEYMLVVQSNLNQCNNEDILLSGTEIEMESYEQESSDSSDEEWSTLSTPRKTKLQGNEKVSLTESVRSAKRCSRRAPAREQNNEHTQSEQLHGSASEQQAREQLHGSISKWFSATRHYSRVAVAKNQKYPGENTTENNSSAIFDGIQVIEPNFGLIDKPDADTNDMISEKLMVQINLNEGIEEDIPPSQYTTRCEEKLTMTQAAISREAGPPGYDPGENFLQVSSRITSCEQSVIMAPSAIARGVGPPGYTPGEHQSNGAPWNTSYERRPFTSPATSSREVRPPGYGPEENQGSGISCNTSREQILFMSPTTISRELGPPGYLPRENQRSDTSWNTSCESGLFMSPATTSIEHEIAQSFSQQRKQREGGGPTYHETFAYAQGPFARVPEAYVLSLGIYLLPNRECTRTLFTCGIPTIKMWEQHVLSICDLDKTPGPGRQLLLYSVNCLVMRFLLYLVNCVVLRTHCSSFCIKCSSDEELLLSLS